MVLLYPTLQDPTEYGLNWNFFFTLAALILLQTSLGALDSFVTSRVKSSGGTQDARETTVFSALVSFSLAVAILIVTQAVLSHFEGLLLMEPSNRLIETKVVSSVARFCLLNAEGIIQVLEKGLIVDISNHSEYDASRQHTDTKSLRPRSAGRCNSEDYRPWAKRKPCQLGGKNMSKFDSMSVISGSVVHVNDYCSGNFKRQKAPLKEIALDKPSF